ncbi:Imm21 family immunity protein [Streptomyces sp. NPDC056112]|uniref:Imm21 family immunity protein n=1 Tax=unclassified Streptomyces TaxID=2593676 RepID=UPI001CD5C76D|nr:MULTISPECIES: Imm21 family immunity protein [unclassified Streptomyces]
MDWLDGTDFGYYALCPAPYLKAWNGTEADVVSPAHVGKVVLSDHGEVLTLGGQGLPVAYLDRAMTFVRWVGCDDDAGLEDAVEQVMNSDEWQDAFEITLGGQYVLLDSGVRGAEVGEDDAIQVNVPYGRYRVQSLLIYPSMGEFFLERLIAI